MKHDLWLPEPTPKQLVAFTSVANELLYGGATRGGKSFFIRWAYCNWCAAIKGLQADIFRLNFDDVIADCMDGHYSFPELLGGLEQRGLVKINQTEIRFWNNSLISLEHASQPDKVKQKHQGIAKHVRAFIEATQISTELVRWLRAWVTMPEEMKDRLPVQLKELYPQLSDAQRREFFPRIIYASNPIGPSAGYFRRYFVKARPRMEVGTAPAEDGGFARQYIPARVEDNPHEDAAATRRRVSGMGDADVADALLNENWDAPVGDFFRQYDELKHTVPDFTPPAYWFKFQTFDWGGSDPFCVLWWCVSDGEEFKDDAGRIRWFPRGSLITYREWYGCQENAPGHGLEMRNEDIAQGILDRTPEETSGYCLTDSLPFQDRGFSNPTIEQVASKKKYTIADVFRKAGVPLTPANTARVFGCSEIKARLTGKDGWPLLYFCECCRYTREYLPSVQRDPKNINAYVPEGEATHASDCVRYACAAEPIVQDSKKSGPLDLKQKPKTPLSIIAELERKGDGRNTFKFN